MLYYQRVQLVIDRGTLKGLIAQLGADQVMTLLRRSEVSAVYCEEFLGVHTESVGAFQIHKFAELTMTGHRDVGDLKTVQDRVTFQLEREGLDRRSAGRFAEQFLRRVPVRRFSGSHFVEGGIAAAAKRDLLDSAYAKRAFREALTIASCGYDPSDNFKLDVIDSELGLYVFTDINLDRANAGRASLTAPPELLTVAGLLSNLLDARADIALASHYGGDFVSSSASSAIVRVRHEELLRRASLNQQSLDTFVDVVLPDMPTVAEVIDSGERTFQEFLHLLDRAERFKRWMHAVNPDEGLVRSYLRDVSSESWIGTLPAKGARYVITQALDATFPATGLFAGLADNFLVEKLLGGWKPNHFVSRSIETFVGTK